MKYIIASLFLILSLSVSAQTTNTYTKKDSVIQKPVLKRKIVPMNRINANHQHTPVDKNKSSHNNVNGKREEDDGQPR